MTYNNSWVSAPPNQNAVGGGTSNFTITIAPNAGDNLAVFVYWQGDSAGTDSFTVSDNASNVYTVRDKLNDPANPAWYVGSATAIALTGPPTVLTVSITSSVGINFINYFVAAYTSIGAFDTHAAQWQDNLVAATAVQSGNMTCGGANDTIVAFTLNLSGSGTQSGGGNLTYTVRQSAASLYALEDAVNPSSGLLTGGAQFSHTATDTFGTVAVAFLSGVVATGAPDAFTTPIYRIRRNPWR